MFGLKAYKDLFPVHRPNACCPFSERTFTGTHGNGRDAP
jgi:hypothetical protein